MAASPIDTTRYHQIEVRIRAYSAELGGYPIELHVAGERDFPPGLLALNAETLSALNTHIDFGQALGSYVFAENAIGKGYDKVREAFQAAGWQPRLNVHIEPEALRSLRWEQLKHPVNETEWASVAKTTETLFSRYVPKLYPQPTLPVVQRPVCVLAVLSSPQDVAEFGLSTIGESERLGWHAVFDAFPQTLVTVDYLDRQAQDSAIRPTLANLRARLLEKHYHIVHFVGHGQAQKREKQTALLLEDQAGNGYWVGAGSLIEDVLQGVSQPHLMFLAACESGALSAQPDFMALGPALVEQGHIPAVVAMAERVGIVAAREFAQKFYQRLLCHGLVDLAMHEGRAALSESTDWSVPVLFSHLMDNRLLADPQALTYLISEIRRCDHAVTKSAEEARRAEDASLQQQARARLRYQRQQLRSRLEEFKALNGGEIISELAEIAGTAWASETLPQKQVDSDDLPQKHKGLIVQVGIGRPQEGRLWEPYTDPAWIAIAYHLGDESENGLQHCWLLASRESYDNAQRLAELCDARGVSTRIYMIKDPFDADETYCVVHKIYAWAKAGHKKAHGLRPKDIIADFTGAVRPMSAGVVLACGFDHPMQYLYGGTRDVASTPRRVRVKWRK